MPTLTHRVYSVASYLRDPAIVACWILRRDQTIGERGVRKVPSNCRAVLHLQESAGLHWPPGTDGHHRRKYRQTQTDPTEGRDQGHQAENRRPCGSRTLLLIGLCDWLPSRGRGRASTIRYTRTTPSCRSPVLRAPMAPQGRRTGRGKLGSSLGSEQV